MMSHLHLTNLTIWKCRYYSNNSKFFLVLDKLLLVAQLASGAIRQWRKPLIPRDKRRTVLRLPENLSIH